MRVREAVGLALAVALLPAAAHAEPNGDGAAPGVAASPAAVATEKANVVFVEVLGNGVFDSVNYERLFADSHLGVRVGFGYVPPLTTTSGFTVHSGETASIPVLVSAYLGSGAHRFALGVGTTVLLANGWGAPEPTLLATAFVGYRYIPQEGGVEFGAGVTPLFGRLDSSGSATLAPWGGIGAGWVF
jgi:hypothetical protein